LQHGIPDHAVGAIRELPVQNRERKVDALGYGWVS
jgi:hypothetical protein